MDDGRVVGIRGHADGGVEVVETARVVVGAAVVSDDGSVAGGSAVSWGSAP
mgnify:CR=1 FL=1